MGSKISYIYSKVRNIIMNFIKTSFEELVIIENNIFSDERGYLSEIYKDDYFFNNLSFKNVLELEVKSSKDVIRGLHYQLEPFAQAKIVRVISGSILDIVVDIRQNSKTFGKYFQIELNDKNKKQLFIPKGFAHGYLVLSDSAKIIYKMDNVYNSDMARGIKFDDETLNIDWKLFCEPILSKQDMSFPSFDKAEVFR